MGEEMITAITTKLLNGRGWDKSCPLGIVIIDVVGTTIGVISALVIDICLAKSPVQLLFKEGL